MESFVEKHGWLVLREIEQRVAHDFCRNFSGIVATGNATIENSKNLQNLKKTGVFVFINPNFSDVKKRLMKRKDVPRMNPEIPLAQELDQLWMQRKDIYGATGEYEVNPELNGDPEIEAQKILEKLPKNIIPKVPPKRRVAFFASGNGTTMQGIFEAQKKGRIPNVEFCLFVTDKSNAPALKRAKTMKIPQIEIVEPRKNESREDYDRFLVNILREQNPDYILLAGWMRILSGMYCDQFGEVTINVHPSLLPKFGGLMDEAVHEQVLEHEEKWTGCTLHQISKEVDGGEIVLQRKLLVDDTDTVKTLKAKVQKQEILGFCEFLEKR